MTVKRVCIVTVLAVVCLSAVRIVYDTGFLAERGSNISSRAKCTSGEKYHRRGAVIKPIEPPWMSLLGDSNAANRTATLYVSVPEAIGLQLGNQLSNYAGLFGIAWRSRRIPLWRPGGNMLVRTAFNIRIPVDEGRVIEQASQTRSVVIRERGIAAYDNRTENLPDRNVTLIGNFQSRKYYGDLEDQLRVDFTFRPNIIKQAKDFINSTTPSKWTNIDFARVVIHVRRGDYVDEKWYRFGWPKTKKDYLDRAMEHFRSCCDRVQFVVISDDIPWCKATIAGSDVVFSEGHSQIVDMAIASLCDHAIITIGTFGNWAAWFANGITITQKDVPVPGSELSRGLRRDEFYKPNYIGL